MIEVQSISKHYQHGGKTVAALDNVSLQSASGEIYGIIGRNLPEDLIVKGLEQCLSATQ